MEPKNLEDQRAIAATVIARTCSPRRAAKRVGVDVATIRQWQADPEFQQMIVEVQTANIMKTVTAFITAGPVAVRVLQEELSIDTPKRKVRRGRPPKDGNPPVTEVDSAVDPRKIRAAKIIIEQWPKYIEMGIFARRIEQLEQQLTNKGHGTPPTPEDDPNTITVQAIEP